ncbi:hypothetical protein [Phaeobacter sp. JH203A]|uniref:hypothetical protein n=1 Tax=Phaeobacter sp. JH203A TaxID=3112501 RepID=UPI003A887400
MTEEAQVAPEAEAAPEAVTPEADQASEATGNTEGQTDGQPAEAEGVEPEAEDKSDRTTRNQRRKAQMDRVRQEAKEAQDRAARLQAELDRVKGVESDRPSPDNFHDHDEYLAELSAYKAEQRMKDRQVKDLEREAEESTRQTQELHQREVEEALGNLAAQFDDARSRYADFDAVARDTTLPINENMAYFMGLSENGADVAYFLGTNRDLAADLARMPAPELAGAMRMLERTVKAQSPRPRTTTTAPDPVNPIRPKATAAKKAEDMSMAEYMAARKAGKI